jgi:hypothetical protein
MEASLISENQNIFNQICKNFFDVKKNNEHEKDHCLLEYGGQYRISVTCNDENEIKRFIDGFFIHV